MFEELSSNLYELIKKSNFQGVPLSIIKIVTLELLHGLAFLSKINLIHCDIKPENILLVNSNKMDIKVLIY